MDTLAGKSKKAEVPTPSLYPAAPSVDPANVVTILVEIIIFRMLCPETHVMRANNPSEEIAISPGLANDAPPPKPSS